MGMTIHKSTNLQQNGLVLLEVIQSQQDIYGLKEAQWNQEGKERATQIQQLQDQNKELIRTNTSLKWQVRLIDKLENDWDRLSIRGDTLIEQKDALLVKQEKHYLTLLETKDQIIQEQQKRLALYEK